MIEVEDNRIKKNTHTLIHLDSLRLVVPGPHVFLVAREGVVVEAEEVVVGR